MPRTRMFAFITEAGDMDARGENVEGMPVGHDDFRELRDRDLYYVDKTPLIDMVLKDQSKVMLFTRPRRFGKSLNMSMLDAYLNIRYAGERDRFSGLKVSELRPDDAEKNSNIIINLNFKGLKTHSYDIFKTSFKNYIINLYGDFEELGSSEKVPSRLKKWYRELADGTADYDTLANSVKYLCQMIELHYGKKPIILIDEYDHPMNMTYGRPELHEDVKGLIRDVLGEALKTNSSMRFAVVTGVMRVSKESIFSGLNNLEVYDVFSKEYDEMFGFTKAEVEKLLDDNGHRDKTEEALEWYGGYRFGETDVCCPWGIINYAKRGCKPDAYWARTSGNSIVTDLVSSDCWWVWKDLEKLFSGDAVHGGYSPEFEYYDRNSLDSSIYSVMVATGYLRETCSEGWHEVSIPNKEIHEVFRQAILRRFGRSERDVSELIRDMVEKDR